MFGLLFCIRAVVTDWVLLPAEDVSNYGEWVGRIVKACKAVSDIVSEVLNSDSPEGQAGSSCDGQTLLMCCWRSSKEVSHLLAALIDKLPYEELGDGAVLSVSEVKDIGNFFTRLLGTTVHRGAFEQAFIGFSNVCAFMWSSAEREFRAYLEDMLDETLTAIAQEEEEGAKSFCATRRSAGKRLLYFINSSQLVHEAKPKFYPCRGTLPGSSHRCHGAGDLPHKSCSRTEPREGTQVSA